MKNQIKTIQVLNQSGDTILDCNKGFSFLSRKVAGKLYDDVLMIKARGLPDLGAGALVNIIINTKGGDRFKYFCRVEFCSSNQLRVIIDQEKARQLENQRRYYRIKTSINCRIVDVTRGENVTTYNPNLYGKIHDINIGGVFIAIETDEKYNIDDLISFTTVLGNNKLETSMRVLRVQTNADGEIDGYKGEFAAISQRDEDMISSYINRLQLEERRIELELEKLEKGTSE